MIWRRTMRAPLATLVGLSLALSAVAAPSTAASPAAASGKDILNMTACWRWHTAMRPPECDVTGKLVALQPKVVNYNLQGDAFVSAAAPDAWTAPDFDDANWPRSRLEWLRPLAFGAFSTHRVFLRGKFEVTDPATAQLRFSCAYRGGVIVYINGRELCRRHLPAGNLDPTALAEAYPADVWLDAGGRSITPPAARGRGTADDAGRKDLEDRIARRERTLEPVAIPADLLRKGVNVIAVEIRRSAYHASALEWFTVAGVARRSSWVTADLSDLALRAGNTGAVPNLSRPKTTQVWVQDRSDRVSVVDYGDPHEPLRAARIAAARNGTFCAQIVAGVGTATSGDVRVTTADLKGPGFSIPAANITPLFLLQDTSPYGVMPWFQGLCVAPAGKMVADTRGGGALLPVLLRVKVPREAAAGRYRGAVRVAFAGTDIEVPLDVTVADWTIPDPRDYRTYIGIYQSPISVALQYNVPPWSDEHWKRLEKSFALLGRVGNKMINVSVADETQFGEPQGMIVFTKKAGGGYERDYTVFDRYLALATKYCGRLDYVCLQIWHVGGWEMRAVDNKCTVPVRDTPGGAIRQMQVPPWGTPEAAAFWQPLFAEMQSRLAAQGMTNAMIVGTLSDGTAPAAVFTTMKAAWPAGSDVRWHRGCHVGNGTESGKIYGVAAGNLVALHEHCYGMSMVQGDVPTLPPLYQMRGRPGTAYFRVSNHEVTASLLSFKAMSEMGLWCQKQGIGRICLDFWPVLKTGKSATDVYNRYPHSSCAQREPSLKRLTTPGTEGAEPNINFEAFAEGLQETEALIVISEAAADEAGVGKELAGRCAQLLRERLQFCHARVHSQWNRPFYHLDHYGWQDLAHRTFELAGEVSRARHKP